MTETEAMKRAVKLALRGSGYVSPNPRVGAVILKDGEIVGKGWHRYLGGPHAEVEAINNATISNFEDAALVVTLEPCTHHGKTPPCADFVVEKKFKRVVIGMVDPNPEVSGKGIEKLKNAGIEIEAGVLEEECRWLNRFFIKYITTKMPYVILKAAQSLDGSIASAEGVSKWISSEESRKRVHILRAQVDAVLVGRSTAEIDDPELTVRHINGRSPMRVVLDTQLSLSPELKLFDDENKEKTIICCSEEAANSDKANELKQKGINILSIITNNKNSLDLKDVFAKLSEKYNTASILVEGGAGVFSTIAGERLADELRLFIAPKIFGSARGTFENIKLDSFQNVSRFAIKGLSMIGSDIQVIATPVGQH